MISNNIIKEQIIELLKTLPVYLPNSSNIQHVVRCPYCPDSANPNHGHFSIKININSDEPMIFQCFKCGTAGILSDTVLNDLGLEIDGDLHKDLKFYNKMIGKKLIKYNYHTKAPVYTIPLYESNKINDLKLDYVSKRLGVDLSYSDAQKIKMIIDPFIFFKLNNIDIENSNTSKKKFKFLNMNYVGFLSNNNNCIIFRNIFNNNYQKHDKAILNKNLLNNDTFYNIPLSFDLLYTNEINIHICEGIYDILSIYMNVNKFNSENNYYFACCGYGYTRIIKYILRVGLNSGINLHIYSDRDKSDNDHFKYLYKLKNTSLIWINRIYIHRNNYSNEKDFGVPITRIDDVYKKISIP